MALTAAFIKLIEIAERSRHNAAGLPAQQEEVAYWTGVGFTLSGQRFVAAMEEVSEILHVPRYTRVPGAQPWMKGVANVRGRLLPVMDLLGFLDKQSALQEKRRRLLVIDKGDLYSGLVVDEVLGMQHFPVDAFTDSNEEVDAVLKPYLEGAYQRDNETWQVFSMARLCEDPRFMQVAKTA